MSDSRAFKIAILGLATAAVIVCAVIAVELAIRPRQANLQTQRECSDAGSRYAEKLAQSPYWVSTHYNPKLNKCFVEASTSYYSAPSRVQIFTLYDVYENRVYAEYVNENDEKSGISTYTECTLSPSYGKTLACKSQDEYKAFVAKYME